MEKVHKEIKARLKGTELRNGKLRRFVLMDEVPSVGNKVEGTHCVYGESRAAELAGWQHTVDQDSHHLYDFWIVNILNEGFVQVGEAYICTPHRSNKEITPLVYTTMIGIAQNCDSVEDFISKALAHDIWAKEDVDKINREEWLTQLYVAVKRSVPEIIKAAHLTQMKLATYFAIPRRTVEGWVYDNKPPIYTIMMIQEILGLVKRK